MKTSLLTNLLIVFAVGLCGLCTFQWLRETESRKDAQKLHDTIFQLRSQVQEQTNRIAKLDLHVAQLTDDTAHQKALLKTNDQVINFLRRETNSLGASNDSLARQLEAYVDAFKQTTNRLAEAYDNIKKQNEVIRGIVADRDQYVARLNEAISNNNILVTNYNALVDRVKEMQDQMAAQQSKGKQDK